jgi:hypothetical protein
MADAPPPPANSRISAFMLPPADWGSATKGGRFTSKADRFSSPARESPFFCHSPGIADSVASRGPNSGYSMRSRSPRLTREVARTPDVQVGSADSPSRSRAANLRTTSPRFASPKPEGGPFHSVLGPSDWQRERAFGHPVQSSASFRSNSPRLSHHKKYDGPVTPITVPPVLGTPSRGHSPSTAVFRATSPRLLPVTRSLTDSFSATPVVLPNGQSAVVSRCDRRAGTLKNGGHAFGDGSRSK